MSATLSPPAASAAPIMARLWPDVARVPPARVRRLVGERLVRRAFDRTDIIVETPTSTIGGGGLRSPRLLLHDPDAFVRRVSHDGLIGFGESYMAGEWDAPDLVGVLSAFGTAHGELIPAWMQRFRPLVYPLTPASSRNSRHGAERNIAHHYDLSNEMFGAFLDETMTYSSALFDAGEPHHAFGLAAAQRRKIDRLLDRCCVGRGSSVLEIGTGWGELAIRAAARGAHVTTITLSSEQIELARARITAAGVSELVDVHLADYREVTGTYDAVLSVEMIEAVGEEYWPTYLDVIDARLSLGGRAGIQAIVMPHHRLIATHRSQTWITKYIFPGGLLPSIERLADLLRATTLGIEDRIAFGRHYADTLAIWRSRFDAAVPDLAAEIGIDDVFTRMWRLYLAYSEAGFRAGLIDVEQLVLSRPVDGSWRLPPRVPV